MGQMVRFETGALDVSERLVRWGEFLSQQPNRLMTRSGGSGPLTGQIEVTSIGTMRLFHIEASPHNVEQVVRPPASQDIIRVVCQVQGQSLLSQGGRQFMLHPGQWTAWSIYRPHAIDNLTGVKQVGLFIPADLLGLSASDVIRHGTAAQGEHPGIAQLFFSQIVELHRQSAAIAEPFRAELVDILLHMLRLTYAEVDSRDRQVAAKDMIRARLVDFVSHNLRDCNLSIEQVAARFGYSKRYIHKVFHGGGQTLSQFLWDERLERCRAALVEPSLSGRSVTEIAFMWGFNNSAHFSKRFKQRFGLSPSQFRSQSFAPTV